MGRNGNFAHCGDMQVGLVRLLGMSTCLAVVAVMGKFTIMMFVFASTLLESLLERMWILFVDWITAMMVSWLLVVMITRFAFGIVQHPKRHCIGLLTIKQQ